MQIDICHDCWESSEWLFKERQFATLKEQIRQGRPSWKSAILFQTALYRCTGCGDKRHSQ